jgi:hypothetical protein
MSATRPVVPRRIRLLAPALAVVAAAAVGASEAQPIVSPDGLWQVLEEFELPPRSDPPTAFVALSLDQERLEALLADAPRETFGPIPPDTRIWLPLAGGGFSAVVVAQSQLMEPALASQFPEIRTYAFAGEGVAGHLALGPGGAHLAGQAGGDLWQVEPVETAAGRIYLSYLDRDRTDGANVIEHDPDMHEDEEDPSVPAAVASSQLAPLPLALEAGQQLRIYRLAASTTGEFYQARDTGNGLLDVVFSLINDLLGANAVFEPEVSVRLILSAASLDVLYDDPDTDPFDNSDTACNLRNANRANMQAVLDDGAYDLGFLFGARSGGGANGCAWFVVCLTTDNTLHKARGAGLMGNNGANSASGLLAHEVGHQLGARHTFTGQAGACTLNEFLAGDSESGYEPGSGTTRMSYNGNCDDQPGDPPPPPPPPLEDDNVDVSAVPAGSYFHSRSFDEIIDNVFNGDGATCGTLVNTGNLPPTVLAGPDYTIPRETPFTLTGDGMDDEPLTFNWEQFDRAVTQRPIDTDPGDGPIIRSVPPGADPSRTIPRLQDLLDGVTRAGEILPLVDRELNFRLIARDNLVGGGGVAYDSMVVTVLGDPFFIISPNSGSLEAACEVPLTWQVGGGSVAAQVEALFSADGGQTFATPLTGAIANDGADAFTVPCSVGTDARIKLQSVGNIFFDINDQDLTVLNTAPLVEVATAGGSVDDDCQFTVEFTASASDACGLQAADVEVEIFKAAENFTLGTAVINQQQVSPTEVSVAGSVVVSDLTSSPAQLAVSVTATDACGLATNDFAEAFVTDDTPPEIDVTLDPTSLWPPNRKLVPIQATVVATDNCPGVAFALTAVTSDEPENGTGDGDTAPDIVDTDLGTPDLAFRLRSERAGGGDGRTYTVTYTAVDGSDNGAEDSATVEVPQSLSN